MISKGSKGKGVPSWTESLHEARYYGANPTGLYVKPDVFY